LPDPIGLVFGALADPSRRQVIGYLSERGTATATELTGELPMTRQAVAKHLATLADAGLVEARRQGRETRYRLTEAGAEWDDRLDALRRHLERRRDDPLPGTSVPGS
jgi:DNA-binding transcriptional ArsR family regulator